MIRVNPIRSTANVFAGNQRRVRAPFPRHVFSLTIAVLSMILASPSSRAAELPPAEARATVLGPSVCAECHPAIHRIWMETRHHKSYFDMHRRRSARRIADRLDIRRIKNSARCARCHYTVPETTHTIGHRPETLAGVSCESCHGPASLWNRVHSDPTNPNRLSDAERLGLARPSSLYQLASTCYRCHTVPDESLVNRGGHVAGSDIELLSWLQGEVRHNVMRSRGADNLEATPSRKRLLFIAGHLLDIEFGLRGLAEAREPGEYAAGMRERVQFAGGQLQPALDALPDLTVSLAAVLQTAVDISRDTVEPAALIDVADRIGDATRTLLAEHDGSQWSALDPLLPDRQSYVGKVFEVPRD